MAFSILAGCRPRVPRSFSGQVGDTTPPSAPVITATAQSDTAISIALTTAATDSSGIASYQLEYGTDGVNFTVLSSNASFSYSHSGLTQTTTYYYRCRATDASPNANVGAYSSTTSAATFSTPTFMWPAQTASYLSCLPRVTGYGMDSYGGSGRDGATGRVTVFFLDDFTTGSVVSAAYPGGYTRILHGNIEGFAAASSPKIMVPIKSGYVNKRDDWRPGNYADIYMQFAPTAGVIFRESTPSTIIDFSPSNASHQRYWHVDSRAGDTSGGIATGTRDSLTVGGSVNTGAGGGGSVVHINGFYGWSLDEIADGYYALQNGLLTFVYCVFAEALHKSIHDDTGTPDMHGYGPIMGEGYRWFKICFQRNLFAHNEARNPKVAALQMAGANNLLYNIASTDNTDGYGLQLTKDYDAASPTSVPMYTNWCDNLYVKGPDSTSTLNPVHMDPSYQHPAGSQGYLAGNQISGYTYTLQSQLMVGSYPSGWLQTSLLTGAWPSGWGSGREGCYQISTSSSPNGASAAENLAFATKIKDSVGPCPTARRTCDRAGTIAQQVLNRLNSVGGQGNTVNSVDGTSNPSGWPNVSLRFSPNAGGWPTISTTTIDPFNPGTVWNNQPLPLNGTAPDDRVLTTGTFSTGVSKVGYTAIEAWAIEQHYYVGGQ